MIDPFNKKISLENRFKKSMLRLHKLSYKNKSVDVEDYKRLLSKINKSIGLVSNLNIYNDYFLKNNVDLLTTSIVDFFEKKDIDVVKKFEVEDENEEEVIGALLIAKAVRDTAFFVQENYERQNFVKEVAKNDENIDQEKIMFALVTKSVIISDKEKVLRTQGDDKVRRTHRHAGGQVQKVNDPFIIDGYRLMFPGDSSLGAPASIYMNCRCYVEYR